MTERHDNTDPLNLASLLRAGADGELSPEDQARLEQHLSQLPDDAARIEFENELRDATARVMGDVRCPDHLRARIEAMAQTPEVISRTDRSFWAGRARILGAVAALLLIGVLGVFIANVASKLGPAPEYQFQVASFVATEHNKCWLDESRRNSKFTQQSAQDVPSEFENLLGSQMAMPDGEAGFIGAGKCNIPRSNGKTVHMQFAVTSDTDESISVFVTPDRAELPLESGVTYEIDTSECDVACRIVAWSKDGLTYFMVANIAIAPSCEALLADMGIAPPTQDL